MIIAVIIGLFSGLTLGLCVAPLWMMLQLPMRITEIFNAGSMRQSAVALILGALLSALSPSGILPFFLGIIAMLIGGVFVGMLAAALVEAVEVIPVLFDRLSITSDMRFAALALAIGKMAGALMIAVMGGNS